MITAERVRIATGIEWPVTSPVTLAEGQKVSITVRPEMLIQSEEGGLVGTVSERRYTGARAFFEVSTELGNVEFEADVHAADVGQTVWLTARTARAFPKRGK